MRVLYSPDELDCHISRHHYWLLAGFAIGALAVRLNGGGILTAAACLSLGAVLGSVASYREEPGIWMLAILFGIIGLGFYGMLAVPRVANLWNQQRIPWGLGIDLAMATKVTWMQVRALASVTVWNRQSCSRANGEARFTTPDDAHP